VVPLAAAPQTEDDRVERGAGIDARPPAGLRRIEPTQIGSMRSQSGSGTSHSVGRGR
jgi:hypothetical protein